MTEPARGTCTRPPKGWWCSLAAGHEGPCPTRADPAADEVCTLCGCLVPAEGALLHRQYHDDQIKSLRVIAAGFRGGK